MKTSACGWPEPSTGISLPRGQCWHSWTSRLIWLSSRIARSRYFSRISSSMPRIGALFDEAGAAPLRRFVCLKRCPPAAPPFPAPPPPPPPPPPPAAAGPRSAPPPFRRLRPPRRLQELQGLDVDQVLVL